MKKPKIKELLEQLFVLGIILLSMVGSKLIYDQYHERNRAAIGLQPGSQTQFYPYAEDYAALELQGAQKLAELIDGTSLGTIPYSNFPESKDAALEDAYSRFLKEVDDLEKEYDTVIINSTVLKGLAARALIEGPPVAGNLDPLAEEMVQRYIDDNPDKFREP